MKKEKTVYLCTQCGHKSLKWLGKCPECGSWNSFSEEREAPTRASSRASGALAAKLQPLNAIEALPDERIRTGIAEFDRVLGGGFIPGSVVLIGGEPGIGKSTLVLQAAAKLKQLVVYATGEESLQQIKMRSARLHVDATSILVQTETNLNTILEAAKKEKPGVIIFDSIQTMYSEHFDNSPGTVTQIRECTNLIMEDAKKKGYVAVIVGHVTKEGNIAGPKILEHIVDTVLQFEGESTHQFRIIRALKNRFGSTNEIGIFEMHGDGLSEVANPSELFLSSETEGQSGSIVSASIEGTRSILIEVQALVTPCAFGNPQRVTTGFDNRRLSILLAVLEKRAGHKLSLHDVFLNIAGGVKIVEPGIDLAVCTAIVSSLLDKPAKTKTAVIGEVGLGGEIRSVSHVEKRIQEAGKLGFKKLILPSKNLKGLKVKTNVQLAAADSIIDAMNQVF